MHETTTSRAKTLDQSEAMQCSDPYLKQRSPFSSRCLSGYSENQKRRRTQIATLIFYGVVVLALESGCARAVLVPESSPVRIGPNVSGHVYVREDEQWVLSDNNVNLPEGWYCVPPSYVEETK